MARRLKACPQCQVAHRRDEDDISFCYKCKPPQIVRDMLEVLGIKPISVGDADAVEDNLTARIAAAINKDLERARLIAEAHSKIAWGQTVLRLLEQQETQSTPKNNLEKGQNSSYNRSVFNDDTKM